MKAIGLAVALLLASGTTAAFAASDGSAPSRCTIQTVVLCKDASACTRGSAAVAGLPPVVMVDVPGRCLTGEGGARTVAIVSVGHAGGRLMLHGQEIEAGTAWNVVIEDATGAMTGGVLTRTGGYLVFGTCSDR